MGDRQAVGERVVLQPAYRVSAPLRLFREEAPPAPPGGPPEAADVSFERRLISEQGAVPADPGAPDAALLSSLAGFGALAERLVRPGVSAEDARLALAMLGADAPLQRACDFAQAVATLRGVGFPPERVCGALVLRDGDVAQAASLLAEGP